MVRASDPREAVMSLTETKQQFSRVVNEVARGESNVVIEKNGLPAAVLISVEEYARLKDVEERRRAARQRFLEDAAAFSEAFRDVPEDEIERELEAIRAEFRREHP